MPSTVSAATNTLGDNVGLVAAVIAVIVAQVLKPFSEWTVTRRFKASLMVGSGGFPSSHSSLVTALATGAAYQAGLGDPAFATALVLALVVRAPPPPPAFFFPLPQHPPSPSRVRSPPLATSTRAPRVPARRRLGASVSTPGARPRWSPSSARTASPSLPPDPRLATPPSPTRAPLPTLYR